MKGVAAHIFDLEQPRTEGMPIHPAHRQAGYSYHLHRRHEDEYRPEETGPRTGPPALSSVGSTRGPTSTRFATSRMP
jgi:hypothetical protein